MGNIREGVDELKALGNQHTKYVFNSYLQVINIFFIYIIN